MGACFEHQSLRVDSPQHTTLDKFEILDQGKGEKEPQLNFREFNLVTSCEERFNLREGVRAAPLRNVEKLEICLVLWARRFEVGATEKVWVHLDFVDDSRTFDPLRSKDPAWSHKILKGLIKTPESRQCHGGLLDWDSPGLGLVMIWESQEVCDVLEVTQEGAGVITVRRSRTLL